MSGIGAVLFGFFEDHLKVQKGLRPGSVKSYRDTLKLFLGHVAQACHRPITKLELVCTVGLAGKGQGGGCAGHRRHWWQRPEQ